MYLVSVIYLFYIKPYISNSIPITVTHTANVIYPSFVISFQGLYLPSNRLPRISITLFLKNSTTSVIKSIIATTKAANITVTGISMSFTYDNNTFIVLNSKCIIIVYTRLSVAILTTAKRSPIKNTVLRGFAYIMLILISSFIPNILANWVSVP